MNREAWKFPLDPAYGGQASMPPGSTFMSIGVQDGAPVMWWSVPRPSQPESEWQLRTFVVAPTGPPGYTDNLFYVGTFQLDLPGGAFVGHVMSFEPVPRTP